MSYQGAKRPVEQRLVLNTVGCNHLDMNTLIKLMWYDHSYDEKRIRQAYQELVEDGGLMIDDEGLVCRGKT